MERKYALLPGEICQISGRRGKRPPKEQALVGIHRVIDRSQQTSWYLKKKHREGQNIKRPEISLKWDQR